MSAKQADRDPLVAAVAQLAVTGRNMFTQFTTAGQSGQPVQDSDVVTAVGTYFPDLDAVGPVLLGDAATYVLDKSYTALWAIRSNDPGWRGYRAGLKRIAVSGFDDTPHRPVNVPTATYPHYDLPFTVPQLGTDALPDGGTQIPVTTRYMVASAHTYVGPDPTKIPLPTGTQACWRHRPRSSRRLRRRAPFPAPRRLSPPAKKIIIYLHGGGSRAEEAVDMASWLIHEGYAVGESYTLISVDMPNSAYAAPFDASVIVSSTYHPGFRHVLHFEEQYICNFIEALDQHLGGGIADRIVAVMGGSLGGNMSLLLTRLSQTNMNGTTNRRSYLDTVIAWSGTATAPAKYLGVIKQGDLAAYVRNLRGQVMDKETSAITPQSRPTCTTCTTTSCSSSTCT